MMKNYISLLKIKDVLVLTGTIALVSTLISCSKDDGEEAVPIPVVTAVSPTSAEPGEDVTISGTDLTDASAVTFNNVPAAAIKSNTATEIVATVPEDATTGKMRVVTAGGTGISPNDFSVIVIGAVEVSSVSSVSAQIGENVTLTGTDMATVSSVKIGGTEATIVGTTDTSVEVTVADGTLLGASTFTIVNEGGSTTTSTETLKFYVIKMIGEAYRFTFDNDDVEDPFSGSPDTEESTVYGRSDDVINVAEVAEDLPNAIDGTFFHMEGYSSTDYSGSYIAIVGQQKQPLGTFDSFFGDATAEDIYFNLQLNFGALPEGYTGEEDDSQMVVGLRFRFAGDDYEYNPTLKELEDMGFSSNEEGWYSVSVPASLFVDDAPLGEFAFADLERIAVVARRSYGSGVALPLSDDPDAVFYTLSFDNANLTVGGPQY